MEDTALPTAEQSAVASDQQSTADQLAQAQTELAEVEAKPEEGEKKPEKDEKDREIARMRRRIDNLTRRLYEERGQRQATVTNAPAEAHTTRTQQQGDDEKLTLSQRELQQLIDQRAREVAPTIKQQEEVIEHRRKVLAKLETGFGKEKFDALASELDDAVGGLSDPQGRPKPVADAIFEADDPQALIEYLADPDHADEAEALGRMNDRQVGRALAKLELKLAAKKAEAKPQPSKAAPPLEPVRGGGQVNAMPDPSDTKAWIRWANEQERKSR